MARKKNHYARNILLIVLGVLVIVATLYYLGILQTILPLGGQWKYANVTLVKENVQAGEIPQLSLTFHPTALMIKECPGSGYNSITTVAIYIDNNFYKIINMNAMKCNVNTSLIVNLPSNLSSGSHAILAKVAVNRFLSIDRIENQRVSCVYNGTAYMWQGSTGDARESYFMEKLKTPCTWFQTLQTKLNITYKCYDVAHRLTHCHCCGRI